MAKPNLTAQAAIHHPESLRGVHPREEAWYFGRIAVHPTDPDPVFVAALGDLWNPNKECGVFMSKHDGATWNQTLIINEDTGVSDIASGVASHLDRLSGEICDPADGAAARNDVSRCARTASGGDFRYFSSPVSQDLRRRVRQSIGGEAVSTLYQFSRRSSSEFIFRIIGILVTAAFRIVWSRPFENG